jgi:hypothetical protein
MNAMRHEEYQELCAAHALGSLDPAESIRLQTHLRMGCEICEAEIAGHQATMEVMAGLVDQKAPPAGAEERLLSLVVGEEPGEEFRHTTRVTPTGGRALQWLLPAAAVVIAGFSLFVAGQSRREMSRLSEEKAALHEMLAATAGPRVTTFEMVTQGTSAHAWVWLVHNRPEDPTDDTWALHASSLSPAPRGAHYHAWLETPGATHNFGPLETDEAGHGYVYKKSVPKFTGEFKMHLTMENEIAAPSPTPSPGGQVILRNAFQLSPKPPMLVLPRQKPQAPSN